METPAFNPFEDRLSRDIRNELSKGLATAIHTDDQRPLSTIIERYRAQNLPPCYSNYVEERFIAYQKALLSIKEVDKDPIHHAVILWDLGLYFEVHEILEHGWMAAEGDYKKLLQALIRSAGVYIKLEYGFSESAKNIAAKALPILTANKTLLQSYFEPQALIVALQNPNFNLPPKLTH